MASPSGAMPTPSGPRAPTAEDIQAVTDTLVREFRPQKVILFGSRAKGTAREDSDVDMLVILPFQGSSLAMMSRMLLALYPRCRFGVLARTPDDVAARYAYGDQFIREVLDTGRVLYEAAA